MSFTSIDPSTGRPLRAWPLHSAAEVERRMARASAAQQQWAALSAAERAPRLLDLAARLRARREELALLAAEEMGKPIREGRSEIEKCAATSEHYAREAEHWLEPEEVRTEARASLVRYEPLGLVLAIMPWNFPYWQVVRCAAPVLAAGNGLLLKHAHNVQGCAEVLEQAFAQAGFPPGLFANLCMPGEQAGKLLSDARVAALSLTGSVQAGRSAAALAGAQGKKCVLELGGSDPFVVLADADLERAVEAAAKSRTINSGQSCIAAKRFIVEEPLYERFEREFARRMQGLRVGDPRREDTDVGPLANAELRSELQRQVSESVAAGARLVLGGSVPQGPGFYYPPTILGDVEPGMAAFREETFGPLAALVRAEDAEHALELANASEFGLAASLWTRAERGLELAPRVQAGSVFVNEFPKSDARLPFGGIKASGLGRELGRQGLLEFTNVKTVWVA